jgi:hypothetical protein
LEKTIVKVQAAAISLAGRQFVIVVVDVALIETPGEANMAADRLSDGFNGADVVLMGQRADDSPVYFGDQDIVESLRDLSIEDMPWKEYRLPG